MTTSPAKVEIPPLLRCLDGGSQPAFGVAGEYVDGTLLVDAYPRSPARLLGGIDVDLVWEGILLRRCYGRNMVFVAVCESDAFHDCVEQGRLHCLADFAAFYRIVEVSISRL